jgi:hypothetical protein
VAHRTADSDEWGTPFKLSLGGRFDLPVFLDHFWFNKIPALEKLGRTWQAWPQGQTTRDRMITF